MKVLEVRDALEDISDNPALAEAFEEMHALLQDDGFDAEYELGVAANEARRLGGSVAVRRFARGAGVAEVRAHVAARIVRLFSRQRVAEIRSRKTVYGFRLGLPYFVQLSRVGDEAAREALVERIFDEILSVDEVREAIDFVLVEMWWRNATLARGLRRLERWGREVQRQLPYWIELSRAPGEEGAEAKRVLAAIQAGGAGILKGLEKLLDRGRKRESN